MRLIDADFIISVLDEAEREYPEHKPTCQKNLRICAE